MRLERGELGELVRSTMLSGVVDLLIDLDVWRLEFLYDSSIWEYQPHYSHDNFFILNFLQLEIGWDDILQDDSSKGIFKMELEDVDETTDDDDLKDNNEV